MWDLVQMLAAFEAQLRQGAKDEAAWNRTRTQIYAEPRELRRERLEGTRKGSEPPPRTGMTLSDVEALIATANATDARYGAL